MRLLQLIIIAIALLTYAGCGIVRHEEQSKATAGFFGGVVEHGDTVVVVRVRNVTTGGDTVVVRVCDTVTAYRHEVTSRRDTVRRIDTVYKDGEARGTVITSEERRHSHVLPACLNVFVIVCVIVYCYRKNRQQVS